MQTIVRAIPVRELIERAHAQVFEAPPIDVIREVVHALGRPTVARFTDTPDLKTVSRWTLERNEPTEERLQRIKQAAVAHRVLLDLGLSATNAEQWFRGANPSLGFTMPVDALRQERYADLFAAIASHAGE